MMKPFNTAESIRLIEASVGRLSNLQKVLLSTDGSVTQILEMVTGNPVDIRTLVQEVRTADGPLAEALDIAPGDDVNHRIVELRDSVTGEVLIYAVSHTPLQRLDPEFRHDLMRADIPIGKIIKRYQLESRREITGAGVQKADRELAAMFRIYRNEPVLNRTYHIIHRKKPLIAIEETFPYNRFLDEFRVIVDTPSRLHISLIDMNGTTGRVDGSIGLALDQPSLLLEASRSGTIEVHGGDEKERERAWDAADSMLRHLGSPGGVSITLRNTFRQHVGLGSGTQLALATASAIAELYGRHIPVTEIAHIAGRGGTSGIGCACFSSGGFLLDGGHSFGAGGEKHAFAPSSASSGIKPAPVISRLTFPEDWRVVVAIPNMAAGASGSGERDIFSAYCPVPLDEVREICHEILMKMLPGIVEHDLDLFGSALNRIQELGFKRVEHSLQPPLIRRLLAAMLDAGAPGAGMSSFGPTVFAVCDTGIDTVESAAREMLGDAGGDVFVTAVRNTGAHIRAA
jgi:beta-ribofuranosylaminobenzene 5'-phosphate synthase